MPEEKDKWLKFHDGQCQFKVPFMLYADFENILKPMDKRYKVKMNSMKADRKGKQSFTWCVYSKFAYGEVFDPLKLKPMAELTDVLKRGHEAAESCQICLKPFGFDAGGFDVSSARQGLSKLFCYYYSFISCWSKIEKNQMQINQMKPIKTNIQ